LTAIYSPQQNSLSEVENQIEAERICFMLYNSNLPVGFWAEATATTIYLINRPPSSHLLKNDMTPHEAWTGTKPSVTELRPFGCLAYAHIVMTRSLGWGSEYSLEGLDKYR